MSTSAKYNLRPTAERIRRGLLRKCPSTPEVLSGSTTPYLEMDEESVVWDAEEETLLLEAVARYRQWSSKKHLEWDIIFQDYNMNGGKATRKAALRARWTKFERLYKARDWAWPSYYGILPQCFPGNYSSTSVNPSDTEASSHSSYRSYYGILPQRVPGNYSSSSVNPSDNPSCSFKVTVNPDPEAPSESNDCAIHIQELVTKCTEMIGELRTVGLINNDEASYAYKTFTDPRRVELMVGLSVVEESDKASYIRKVMAFGL